MTAQGLVLENLLVEDDTGPLVALDRTVAPGEVLTLMAPSGAGKSTALAAILGALPSGFRLSGRIWLDGREIGSLPTHRRQIGLLFQDDLLFPHLSVGGNLAFALPADLRGRAARREAIEAALADVGLSGFHDRDPATLSGGQRARVALMRSLLARPRALLLDEPFARLDQAMKDQMRRVVFEHTRSMGLPVILVTHDLDDARAAAGPVITPMSEVVVV